MLSLTARRLDALMLITVVVPINVVLICIMIATITINKATIFLP